MRISALLASCISWQKSANSFPDSQDILPILIFIAAFVHRLFHHIDPESADLSLSCREFGVGFFLFKGIKRYSAVNKGQGYL